MLRWLALGSVLVGSSPAVAECGTLAREALAAAREVHEQLASREIDACSVSLDVVSKLPGALLRFRPHEELPAERRH